jgi:tyrosyl-DNA phosphodiesterase-1
LTDKWVSSEFLSTCITSNTAAKQDLTSHNIHLVWPTVEFVKKSIDGLSAGGSLCLAPKNMKPFLKPKFRKYVPNQPARSNIPPHIKTFARASSDNSLAWICLTSANLSTAAWGQLQKNASQLMIRNYEIGVLFLPSLSSMEANKENEVPMTTSFKIGKVPQVALGKEIQFPLPYL